MTTMLTKLALVVVIAILFVIPAAAATTVKIITTTTQEIIDIQMQRSIWSQTDLYPELCATITQII